MKLNFLLKLPDKKPTFLLFFILFVSLGFFYKLHQTMFYRPQSLHAWRQADCLSITQNYYQYNNHFWEPEIHNQISENHLSGKSAGEFPILYFSVAQIWKLFGKSEFAYRLIVLLISFAGLCCIFLFSREILRNSFQSLFISLGLFTSVIYVYYGANFLPNVPALSMIFIGWYFIWKFYKNEKQKYLWISMLFFSVGMLLKVSAGISFVALCGWMVLEFFSKKEKRILFRNPIKQSIPFMLSIIVAGAWYIYAQYYNDIHGGKYTFNNIWPIWELTNQQIRERLQDANILIIPAFFNGVILFMTGAMWLYLLVTYKNRSVFLNYLLLIIPFGAVVYMLLWFQAINVHDYYFIDLYLIFILVWVLFFQTIGKHKWINNWAVNLLLIVVFIYGIVNCEKVLKARYTGWPNDIYKHYLKAVGELEPILKEIGIDQSDKVISIPDFSINTTLYLMNQKGFSNYNSPFNTPESLLEKIGKGAKYLVVNDTLVIDDPSIKPFLKHPITTFKNVKIFDLRPFQE